MERPDPFLPDWRDAADYAPLLKADRFILAWEWLRRIPDYARAARDAGRNAVGGGAARWGLHRFEDPALAAPSARPMWRAAAARPVLEARATNDPGGAAIDVARIAGFASLHAGEAGEHILLTDGLRALRLDIREGTIREGPVRLRFLVEGPPSLAAPILALRRFDALMRQGCFAPSLHRPEPRAERLLRVLRAADAIAAGAGQRAIAAELLRGDVAAPRWREDRPELRLQAQRLVRDARGYLAGGYRALLTPSAGIAAPRVHGPARPAEHAIASLPAADEVGERRPPDEGGPNHGG